MFDMKETMPQSATFAKIEKAIGFIDSHTLEQPNLDAIAQSVQLSKSHFNRMFKQWAGIGPIQFLQYLTLGYAKKLLAGSENILSASIQSGLSGPSRLHDLFVNFDAMTPGEFKKKGAGLSIDYGIVDSPFGACLIAKTQRGICHIAFVEDGNEQKALAHFFSLWPAAELQQNRHLIEPLAKQLFSPVLSEKSRPFHVLLRGSNFQVNVWEALLRIPSGAVVSYQDVARYVGRPQASRAVANAIAHNPIAYLIPCHRVITKSGKFHQYRWGATRKKALLGWEAAQQAKTEDE